MIKFKKPGFLCSVQHSCRHTENEKKRLEFRYHKEDEQTHMSGVVSVYSLKTITHTHA
jgi:hypothetical protein